MKNEVYDKVEKKSLQYWEKRERILEQEFNKTTKQMMKELKHEYQRAWNEIEKEIQGWYATNITDANFKWSELHNLEDTQKAIEIILDELYDIEREKLSENMDNIYISSYQDMHKLTNSYFNAIDKAVPKSFIGVIEETNRVASMTGIEQMLRKEIDMRFLSKNIWDRDDILKKPLEWYQGFAGDRFENRIERRKAIVKHEINQAIRNAYIKGSSVDKATKDIMDRLNPHGLDDLCEDVEKKLQASYRNAKRLAHNELTHAQLCADARQCKENGFKGVKRKIVDDDACEKCKEKARSGEIIPIDEYYANPSIFQVHVNDRCMPCPTMVADKDSPLSFAEFHALRKQGKEPKTNGVVEVKVKI